jgi:hypothetical protein
MKLRIKGNSIRLRLGQSDVRRLAIEGEVQESTAFGRSPNERFGYMLLASPEEPAVRASYTDRGMVIRVPRKLIDQWITTDQVGIHAIQSTGDDNELRILIEKDFECIDAPSGESQEDAFPNPQLEAACRPAGGVERST